jgi:hypothetical protein
MSHADDSRAGYCRGLDLCLCKLRKYSKKNRKDDESRFIPQMHGLAY